MGLLIFFLIGVLVGHYLAKSPITIHIKREDITHDTKSVDLSNVYTEITKDTGKINKEDEEFKKIQEMHANIYADILNEFNGMEVTRNVEEQERR